MDAVYTILCILLGIYYWVIIARLITSWFPRPPEALRPVFAFLYMVTEPVLRLARPLVPPLRIGMGAMDLSPLVVFVVLYVLQRIVCGLTG